MAKSNALKKINRNFVEMDNNNKKLMDGVIDLIKKKFSEVPEMEWVKITVYEDDPDYPDVICKFKNYADPYDIDSLSDDLQVFVDYFNNDMAGILSGYDNILAFENIQINRKELEKQN